MTCDRFAFQLSAARAATGLVLNVGCREDPAGLKAAFGRRLVNCDRYAEDESGSPLPIDAMFDCTAAPWPFPDDYAGLVIFGDILEHLTEEEMVTALTEARRVASKVCITVPEDTRLNDPETAERYKGMRAGALHRTIYTEELMRRVLSASRWRVLEWQRPHYFFVARGHFILAERTS